MSVEMKPVTSSNVAAIGYHPEARELHVAYQSGGTYVHENVPPDLHGRLMAAESVGKFLHQHVKPHFTARKA